jgi:hypothetical protein
MTPQVTTGSRVQDRSTAQNLFTINNDHFFRQRELQLVLFAYLGPYAF